MSSSEFNRVACGEWSVVYQPDMDFRIQKIYEEILNEFQHIYPLYIYQRMKSKRLACISAVQAEIGGLEKNDYFRKAGFIIGDSTIRFSEKLTPDIPQSGQNILKFSRGDSPVISVVDVAAYLYEFDYPNLPIAVGEPPVVERALSEIYSSHLGMPFDIRFFRV